MGGFMLPMNFPGNIGKGLKHLAHTVVPDRIWPNHNGQPRVTHQLCISLPFIKKDDLIAGSKILTGVSDYFAALLAGHVSSNAGIADELKQLFIEIPNGEIREVDDEPLDYRSDERTVVVFEQVEGYGESHVRVTFGESSERVQFSTTLASFQDLVSSALGYSLYKPHPFQSVDTSYVSRKNILQEEAVKAKFSEVTKITYCNKSIWFYKPIEQKKNVQSAAAFAGIDPVNNRFANRSIFTYQLSELLGFKVIPLTMRGQNKIGIQGYIQKEAGGQSGADLLDYLLYDSLKAKYSEQELDEKIEDVMKLSGEELRKFFLNETKISLLTSNNDAVRNMILLQLLDAITGQVDRHAGNYYLSLNTPAKTCKVSGIDNDACMGFLVAHPNDLIPRYREDGFTSDNLKELPKHEQDQAQYYKTKYGINISKLVNSKSYKLCGRSVFLPPVMDTEMVSAIKKLTDECLLSYMEEFNFNNSEQQAGLSRLKAVKDHISVLEQQHAKGKQRIISPTDWCLESTRDALKLFEKPVGNAIVIFTSYLQRDIALFAQTIRPYEEEEWSMKARKLGYKHYEKNGQVSEST